METDKLSEKVNVKIGENLTSKLCKGFSVSEALKILYVNSYQGPDVIAQRLMQQNRAVGGTRKIDLISRLLQNHGHEVTILSAGIPAERSGRWYPSFESTIGHGSKEHGADVLYASGLDIRYLNHCVAILSAFSLIKKTAITKKFDMMLIYNIDEFTMSVASYYWYGVKKIPMVLEYEDGVNILRGSSVFKQYIRQKMETWLRRRLAGAICVNHNLSHRLSNPNTYILPGIVDDDLCRMAKLRKLPLSGKPPYLALYSGSLTAGKGVQFIPKIASKFKDRIRFVITGEGPLYTNLVDAAKRSEGNVEVLGYVERDRLNELLTSADFLLNPHEEELSGAVLPFKLIEYLAAGSIVMTTKIKNVHHKLYEFCEIIEPEAQSIIDVLEYMITQPEEGMNRSTHGQEWVLSNYSSSEVGKSLNKIVNQSVISNPGKIEFK